MKQPTREDVLRALPDAVRPLIEALLDAARKMDRAVYLVGGPVRDFLLERPIRDVDLLLDDRVGTDAKARTQTFDGWVRSALPRARITLHSRFRTLRIECEGAVLDVASARRESYPHAGALPSTEPGALEEDLRRRDFTVNALALPLSPAARRAHPHVTIVDPASGCADLQRRVLRVFHPRSFHDDPTRALRAARFAVGLGFRLQRATRTALRNAIRDGAFGRVSGERYRREIEKLFADSHLGLDPAAALRLLQDWHVLGALEPGLEVPSTAWTPLRRLGRIGLTPPWPLPELRFWLAGLLVWLTPLRGALRRRTLARLAVRGVLFQCCVGFAQREAQVRRGLQRTRGRGAVDALLGGFSAEEIIALYVGAEASARRRIARYVREDRGRATPLTGTDLTSLGFAGPEIGHALARVRAAFLDGWVKSREDALALVRELAHKPPHRSERTRRQA